MSFSNVQLAFPFPTQLLFIFAYSYTSISFFYHLPTFSHYLMLFFFFPFCSVLAPAYLRIFSYKQINL